MGKTCNAVWKGTYVVAITQYHNALIYRVKPQILIFGIDLSLYDRGIYRKVSNEEPSVIDSSL